MKTTVLTICIILISSMCNFAQVIHIQGTNNKTTSLIFPSDIVHIDLGIQNDCINVGIDENVPHLLKLRMSDGFTMKTNMLVVTQDEHVYSFEITYSDTLSQYVRIIKTEAAVNYSPKILQTPTEIEAEQDTISKEELLNRIQNSKDGLIRSDISRKGRISLFCKNIYVHNDDLYFLLEINNQSNLKYTIDFYNLFMASKLKKSLKGTTSQDIQMDFDFVNDLHKVIAGQIAHVIIHVKKFTLEEDKIAILEIYEKEGGRHMKIKISNNELLNATQL